MMRTQCLLGLRTFVAFATKLWSFLLYMLRRQVRTVSTGSGGPHREYRRGEMGGGRVRAVAGLCRGARPGCGVSRCPPGPGASTSIWAVGLVGGELCLCLSFPKGAPRPSGLRDAGGGPQPVGDGASGLLHVPKVGAHWVTAAILGPLGSLGGALGGDPDIWTGGWGADEEQQVRGLI